MMDHLKSHMNYLIQKKIKNLKENIQCYEADLRQCRELLEELEHEEADTKEDFLTKISRKDINSIVRIWKKLLPIE